MLLIRCTDGKLYVNNIETATPYEFVLEGKTLEATIENNNVVIQVKG